jgi:methyltransferase (TIGR00027 family)
MTQPDPAVRNVSDTASWAAYYRAVESARRDALFHDPFAARLAGERGKRIADAEKRRARAPWAWTVRTLLFDELLRAELAAGADLVVNFAAGLDARPYRMDLSPELRWVEVDLPGPLDFKEQALAGETPRCRLERVRLDLADVPARQAFLADVARGARRAVAITEGLVIYLEHEQVMSLGRDLAAQPAFQRWLVDIVSPGLLARMKKTMRGQLEAASSQFKFAPPEGADVYRHCGWQPLEVRRMLTSAKRLRRLPWLLRLLAFLPDNPGPQGKRPWAAVILLGRG